MKDDLYTLHYPPPFGHLEGVLDENGRAIPMTESNRDWRRFVAWNAVQEKPLDLDKKEKNPPKDDKPL